MRELADQLIKQCEDREQALIEALKKMIHREYESYLAQVRLVTHVHNLGLHTKYDYRNALQHWLQDNLDMKPTTAWVLATFGGVIVPYCDDHHINIDMFIYDKDLRKKLRDAVYVLRKAIKQDNEESVREILAFVFAARNRNAVRQRYHDHRDKPAAAVIVTEGTKMIVEITLDNAGQKAKVLERLGTMFRLKS